jgi:folate-binding protein YgfZ
MSESHGNVTSEYLALRREAGIVTGEHDVLWVEGPDAVAFLDGLLSQDVAGLSPGEVARSFLLEPRGKLRALLWVLRGEGAVGLVCDAGRADAVIGDLEHYRFRVDVSVRRERRPVVEVWGPAAPAVLEAGKLAEPGGWADREGALVASLPLGALDRFVIAGRSASDMVEAGGIVAGARAARAVRVEAGEPKMGEDLDEATIPNETGLVPFAVSFTKGCYLGQELVARIDSRGRVNRHLRGVVITENVLPPDRAAVMVGEAEVGRVTSVVESLTLRAPVGLALVRREVEPGTDVAIAWAGRSIGGTVRALPLDDFSDPSQYSNSPP